jgi:hypothetical protein
MNGVRRAKQGRVGLKEIALVNSALKGGLKMPPPCMMLTIAESELWKTIDNCRDGTSGDNSSGREAH